MSSRIFGSGIRRREDPRLITGAATYTDDLSLPGMLYAATQRSPHAHASIKRMDTSEAKDAPGVVAAYTGAVVRDALNAVACASLLPITNLKNAGYAAMAIETVH